MEDRGWVARKGRACDQNSGRRRDRERTTLVQDDRRLQRRSFFCYKVFNAA
jgi:hypothetical protein